MNNMSNMPASSLPKITALRHELDYGDPGLARCSAFYDDVRAFRKKYNTRHGLPGFALHDWKSLEHQLALADMTRDYLDEQGNGRLFWPDDPSATTYNKLQYSKDNSKIKRLVKQLFFRLNEQQHRNNKYKHKDKQPVVNNVASDRQGAPRQSAPRQSAPEFIDLDGIGTEPETQSFSSSEQASRARSLFSQPDNTTSQPPRKPQAPKRVRGQLDDVYAVPGSPGLDDESDVPLWLGRQPSKTKPPSRPTADSTQGHQAKRVRVKPPSSNEIETQSSTPNQSPQSTSKRKYTPRQKKDYLIGPDYSTVMDNVDAVGETRPDPDHAENRSPKRSAAGSTIVIGGSQSSSTDPNSARASKNLSPSRQRSTQGFSSINRPRITSQPIQAVPERRNSPVAQDSPPTRDSPTATHDKPTAPHVSPHTSSSPKTAPQPSSTADDAPPRPASGKPVIDFVYRLVLSRSPVLCYRNWKPARKLEETTYGEFMDELSLDADVNGLYFTVEGPGLKAVEDLRRGDETGFQALIKQIKRVILRQIAILGSNSHLIFEMEVEPIREDEARGYEELDDAQISI